MKEKKKVELLSIDTLELSVRGHTCLKEGGILTIGELSKKTAKELLKIKNLRREDIDEYRAKLGSLNLSLENDYEVKGVIEDLVNEVKKLTDKVNKSDVTIGNLRKSISAVSSNLKLHINKKTAQIRVFENYRGEWKWSGYTGVFYIDEKDNQKKIIKKAYDHYERHFKDDDFYKNRTLGLFTTNAKGQKLVKILQDNENKLENSGIKNRKEIK